jgi:hypothetical protein
VGEGGLGDEVIYSGRSGLNLSSPPLPKPLPQEGGAFSLIYRYLHPLLSWEKGAWGMRPMNLGEGGWGDKAERIREGAGEWVHVIRQIYSSIADKLL